MATATKARKQSSKPVAAKQVAKAPRRKPEPQPEPVVEHVSTSSRSITELRYRIHDALENATKPLTVNQLLNMFPENRAYLIVRIGFMLNRGDWAIDGYAGKEADAKDETANGPSFKLGSKIVAEAGKKPIRIVRKLKRRLSA